MTAKNATSTKPTSTESTALTICASIPWKSIISTATPYVKKYGAEALKSLGSKIKSCVGGSSKGAAGVSGSCAGCCLSCSTPKVKVPKVPDTKLPDFKEAPGNKKAVNNGDSSSNTSVIDYPNPFQEKLYEDTPVASASTRRISAAFKRRLSRVSVRSNTLRSSVIYEPTAFEGGVVTNAI